MDKSWLRKIGITVSLMAFAVGAMVTVATAAGSVKVILNGQEIKANFPIQTFKGQTMVPLRWLAEAMGAEVDWDKQAQTVTINDEEKRKLKVKADRMQDALEEIVAPKTPDEAVTILVQGMKERNAAIQYAVMSPDLRKRNLATYDETYWITGGSSPWVVSYQIINKKLQPDGACELEVKLHMKTSAEEGVNIIRVLAVSLRDNDGNEKWLINDITDTDRTELLGYNLYLDLPAGWEIWRKVIDQVPEFYVNDTQSGIDSNIQILGGFSLPNHSETISQKKVACSLGEGTVVVLNCSYPAASGKTEIWKEVHLLVPLDNQNWLDIYVMPTSEEDVVSMQAALEKIAAGIQKVNHSVSNS